MKKLHSSILFGVAFLVSLQAAQAGGWVQPKGKGFYKLGSRLSQANRFIELVDGPSGKETHAIDIPTLTDFTLSLYAEYGVTQDLTAVLSFPFYRRITLNRQVYERTNEEVPGATGDVKNGIADTDVGLRYNLGSLGGTVFSAQLTVGLPIGDVDQPSGLYTGDGEFNFVGDLAFGRSFQRVPIYVTGGVGYNLRTQGFSDEFRYTLEAGWSIGNFLAILRVRGIESLENGDSDVLGMTLGNNQSYIAYGPEVAYKFTKTFGVSAGLDTAKRIRNTISGPTYNFGVYAEL